MPVVTTTRPSLSPARAYASGAGSSTTTTSPADGVTRRQIRVPDTRSAAWRAAAAVTRPTITSTATTATFATGTGTGSSCLSTCTDQPPNAATTGNCAR